MRALVKTARGNGNVELIEIDEPQCAAGMVKIEVKFSGICGTDLHILHDTFINYPPVVLGHEFSGVVTEIGSGVRKVKAGDRVTVLPSTAVICGACPYCREGKYIFCSRRRGMGFGVHGSFTKYVVVREDMVYPIPDHLSFEEAALAEPVACAVHALEELTAVQGGDAVLVSGPGPIGLICLTLLAGRGLKVIVAGTTQDEERLKLARRLGAERVVDVLKEDLMAAVNEETGGKGVDVAVECAGAAASVRACLEAVKKTGKMVQMGIAGKDITLPYDLVLYKEIRLQGSVSHCLATWDRVMQLFGQNKIRFGQVITHKYPLSRWREAFDLCEQKRGGKVLLYYDEPA